MFYLLVYANVMRVDHILKLGIRDIAMFTSCVGNGEGKRGSVVELSCIAKQSPSSFEHVRSRGFAAAVYSVLKFCF